MSEASVQKFPFESLPQFSGQEIDLVTKLTQSLSFLTHQSEVIPSIQKLLTEIIGQEVHLKVTNLKTLAFDDFSDELSKTTVNLILQKQPESVPALMSFDALLAKVLVKLVVNKKVPDSKMHAELSVQPVSYLEFGVLEYILVRLLCALQAEQSHNFSGWLYNEIKSGKSFLGGVFSHQDELISLKLSLQVANLKPFYLQIVLPLKIVQKSFNWPKANFVAVDRLKQFKSEEVSVELQVGQVSLTGAEVDQLEEGDILLLDRCGLNQHNKEWQGQAQVVFEEPSLQKYGYDIELESQKSEWKGKVISSLSRSKDDV